MTSPDLVFTYNPALATSLDKVRWLIGDTDPEEPLLDDREINKAVVDNAVVDVANASDNELEAAKYRAAIVCCMGIASKFARQTDTAVDLNQSIKLGDRYTHYVKLAGELQAQLPFFGGFGGSTVKLVRV